MSPNVGSTQGTRCAPWRLFSGDARFEFLTGSQGPGARGSGQEVGSVVSEAGLSALHASCWCSLKAFFTREHNFFQYGSLEIGGKQTTDFLYMLFEVAGPELSGETAPEALTISYVVAESQGFFWYFLKTNALELFGYNMLLTKCLCPPKYTC